MSFDRAVLAKAVRELAQKGIYIGTSSWKYPGWCGMLYESARYDYRGKFAMTRFERNCLEEYAAVFKTVSVDAAFYKFPERNFLETIMGQAPGDFQFSFKVTDTITIKKFPNLPKFGMRAGEINRDFLNADLFAEAFLKTCEPNRSKVGLLMFEFGRIYKADFSVAGFSQALDTFFQTRRYARLQFMDGYAFGERANGDAWECHESESRCGAFSYDAGSKVR